MRNAKFASRVQTVCTSTACEVLPVTVRGHLWTAQSGLESWRVSLLARPCVHALQCARHARAHLGLRAEGIDREGSSEDLIWKDEHEDDVSVQRCS